jgi:hypothetical protein
MTASASSTFALQGSERQRAIARQDALEQWPKMSEAMIEEEGLLNYAQAALVLNVSVKRINELVRQRTLEPFEFFGRTYVSVRQVRDRYREGLKAGFPPLTKGQRLLASLKAATKTDLNQARLGGYAGPHFKKLHKEQKERRRAESKRKWRAFKEAVKGKR